MSSYFIVISFINLFSLLMLIFSIENNSVINKFQKINFLITCSIIFVICVMEVLTIIFNGAALRFRFLHIVSNYFGFALTPLVYMTLGNALLPEFSIEKKHVFFLLGAWFLYSQWLLFMVFANSTLGVFYVDSMNNYSRAKGFFVYWIFYCLGLLYFFIQNIILSLRFWQNNCGILFLNVIFVLAASFVQVVRPDIQVTWLSVIISVSFYFMYHNSLYQQFDIQTYLRNYQSFIKKVTMLKKDAVLVLVEIDNFEKLKLNYNRQKVDSIVVEISRVFSSFYRKYGSLFRLGTEEFCVIAKDISVDFDKINKAFFAEFIKECSKIEEMPFISVGWAKIAPQQDINNVLSLADLKKREFINERPSYLF